MGHYLFILVMLLLGSALRAQNTPGGAADTTEALRQDIDSRVDQGDYSAFAEAAKLPTAEALRFLYILYSRGAKFHKERDAAAISALRSVPNYDSYYADHLKKAIAEGKMPYEDFQILSLIGTGEAQAVVAPYLFDFKKRISDPADLFNVDWNCAVALVALSNMDIRDGPKFEIPTSDTRRLMAWQRWAIDHGFVPKEWIDRVGVPKEWAKWDAATAQPALVVKPRAVEPTPSVVPKSSLSGQTSEPDNGKMRLSLKFNLLIAASCAFVSAAIAYVLFRRRRRR